MPVSIAGRGLFAPRLPRRCQHVGHPQVGAHAARAAIVEGAVDCTFDDCSACGVCPDLGVANVLAAARKAGGEEPAPGDADGHADDGLDDLDDLDSVRSERDAGANLWDDWDDDLDEPADDEGGPR